MTKLLAITVLVAACWACAQDEQPKVITNLPVRAAKPPAKPVPDYLKNKPHVAVNGVVSGVSSEYVTVVDTIIVRGAKKGANQRVTRVYGYPEWRALKVGDKLSLPSSWCYLVGTTSTTLRGVRYWKP